MTHDLLVVTYDDEFPKATAYIYLVPIGKGEAVNQRHCGPDIILDFNKEGQLLGIELLDISNLHPKLKEIAVHPWTTIGDV